MSSFVLEFNGYRLDLGSRTCVMGILNTTPDSFSDGGRFNTLEAALRQGRKLVADGAHILDIGGESTRPFSAPVSESDEIQRVVPVIRALAGEIGVPISIDTVKSGVAAAALDAGASIINDISALEKDPAMADLAAEKDVPVILMHMKGSPQTMQVNPVYDDLMTEIADYLSERAAHAMSRGIRRERIILDPGIGFGKTVEHNLTLINRLERIVDLGFPVLMGPSRKSFIYKILSGQGSRSTGPDHARTEYGTLAAVAASILKGAHIVRVHDVEKAGPFTRILDSIRNAS